jgi:hypothetical protein
MEGRRILPTIVMVVPNYKPPLHMLKDNNM